MTIVLNIRMFPVGKKFSTSTLTISALSCFGITTLISKRLISDAGDPNLVSDLHKFLH